MGAAWFALHVIAALRFLDHTSALGAVPRIVLLLPYLESVVAKDGLFVLVARQLLVADRSALGTYRGETCAAGKDFAII